MRLLTIVVSTLGAYMLRAWSLGSYMSEAAKRLLIEVKKESEY
jgi:hypothetical protein